MFDRLHQTLQDVNWLHVGAAAGILVATAAAATGVALYLLLELPNNYLLRHGHAAHSQRGAGFGGWARVIGRNVIGAILVLAGLFMAMPGVIGPGIPVLLAGVILLDFPGKRRLLVRLMQYAKVRNAINAFRQRHRRAPLRVPLLRRR